MENHINEVLEYVAESEFAPTINNPQAFLERFKDNPIKYHEQMLYMIQVAFKQITRDKDYWAKRNMKFAKYDPIGYDRMRKAAGSSYAAVAAKRRLNAKQSADATADRLEKLVGKAEPIITILEEWKVNGVALGDATRSQINWAADHAEKSAHGQMLNHQFYQAIARKLPTDASVVREFISPDEAERIRAAVFTSESA